jgi:hypothetical protein
VLFEDETWISEVVDVEAASVQALFMDTASRDADFVARFGPVERLYGWLRDPDAIAPAVQRLGLPADLMTALPEPDSAIHVSDHQLAAVGAEAGPFPRLTVSPAKVQALKQTLAFESGPPVFIHAGAGGDLKRWPLEQFLELARDLAGRGFPPVFLFGPADETVQRDFLDAGTPYRFVSSPPLSDLASLLSLGAGFVGNDSGPAHVAAAAGVTVLALFGPTDPALWAPRGERVGVLLAEGGKLIDLPEEEVLKALLDLLAETLPS